MGAEPRNEVKVGEKGRRSHSHPYHTHAVVLIAFVPVIG